MQNQNQPLDLKLCVPLPDRRLISVSGPDAADFLQNIMTADIRTLTPDNMLYTLLLTPQGQFLHDFFVSRQPAQDGFLVDIFSMRTDDFLSRMKMFKLRAKVEIHPLEDGSVKAYAHPSKGLPDPRHGALGCRLYTTDVAAGSMQQGRHDDYIDLCTRHGVPDTPAIQPQKDFAADMNLDVLGAIAWDKGCYIGQEVTARMHYKGLAKKRLLIVEGRDITEGDMLFNNGRVVGEVRQSNPRESEQALAIVRLDSIEGLSSAGNKPVSAVLPSYLENSVS